VAHFGAVRHRSGLLQVPWVKQPWGVVAATLLMIGLSAGVFMFFKRRDWL
jgi:hypothetical protein